MSTGCQSAPKVLSALGSKPSLCWHRHLTGTGQLMGSARAGGRVRGELQRPQGASDWPWQPRTDLQQILHGRQSWQAHACSCFYYSSKYRDKQWAACGIFGPSSSRGRLAWQGSLGPSGAQPPVLVWVPSFAPLGCSILFLWRWSSKHYQYLRV